MNKSKGKDKTKDAKDTKDAKEGKTVLRRRTRSDGNTVGTVGVGGVLSDVVC